MTSTRRALWWTLAAWLGIYAALKLAQGPPVGVRPKAHLLGILLDVVLGAPVCFLILLFVFRVGAGVRRALVKQDADVGPPSSNNEPRQSEPLPSPVERPNSGIGRRLLLASLGVTAAAVAALFASGGVYRTVNAGGGQVYIVNRFTGRSRLLGAAAPRSQTAKEAERVLSMLDEARARAAPFVGDARTRLYHDRQGGYSDIWFHAAPADDFSGLARALRKETLEKEARRGRTGAEWVNAVCPALRRNLSPVYFDNAHEALSEGYWPCADCLPTRSEQVVAERATTRAWPAGGAPRGFALKRGDEVTVIATQGEWAAVSLWYPATGKRTYGWVRDDQLLWPGTNDVRQWCADAEDAQHLRAAGSSTEAIAAKRHWRQWYVERLLQADPTPD